VDPDIYSFTVVMGVLGSFIATMVALFVGARFVLQRSRPRLLTPVDDERFARLEQAIDTMAIEVERMTEAQRFTAKLLSERAGAGSPGDQR